MKLCIVNGSPRGKNSNTSKIIKWMFKGKSNINVFYTAMYHDQSQLVKNIKEYETYLIIFPLYTDAMPYAVKSLFEHLEKSKVYFNNKNVYFIIHSGFPEARQSRPVEGYTKYFAELIGMNCVSTAVKGHSEGFRFLPEVFMLKTIKDFAKLGRCVLEGAAFNEKCLKRLAYPEKLSGRQLSRYEKKGCGTMYWNVLLKKNKAFKQRFAVPFLDKNNST